ncbi:baseplate J/gp47 family protein [Paenibacillus alvei]|uniref:baseplate J/gp47 family protein n=1 Tax=Paenibacillus alvei TaxID=44250 RepID=UPI0022809877|nr:baseplate J/gp47 family protein [Paenibacillus alvei]MCY7484441.1 baseplate J/gp47 family protein [Paenibacillus alvei]
MLDSKGFKRQRFAELFEEMEAKAKEVFGESVNTSERSPLGIILRIFAWFLSKLWQDTEATYNSAYINTAEGVQLDRLGPHVGIRRNPEQYATGQIQIAGTAGQMVPAGFRVQTSTDVIFMTTVDVELDSTGGATVDIRAIQAGRSGNVAPNMIAVISNPVPGITSITNTEATAGGREIETDQEFRERFSLSVAGGGAATVDSVRSALLGSGGVRAAVVIENTSMTPDALGRPPKSFEAYVLGGDPESIGRTILNTKAAGIETYGDQSVEVTDLSGNVHMIKYSNAVEVQIYIKATLRKNPSYPADGDEQVVSALVRDIGGEDIDGQLYVGLNMGAAVIHSRLVSAAYKVAGIDDIKLELSKDGTVWTEDNIYIAAREVAQTSHDNITVVVT